MTDCKRKTCVKIQSAKHWLTCAEQAIGRDSTVRCQMDLLLAEAELKSVKENLGSNSKMTSISLLQHSAAFSVAVVILIFSIGGALWWTQQQRGFAVITPNSMTTIPAQAVKVQAPVVQSIVPAPVVHSSEPRQEVYGSTSAVNKEPSVSSDEMQRLIRAAGQSLRGQSKP